MDNPYCREYQAEKVLICENRYRPVEGIHMKKMVIIILVMALLVVPAMGISGSGMGPDRGSRGEQSGSAASAQTGSGVRSGNTGQPGTGQGSQGTGGSGIQVMNQTQIHVDNETGLQIMNQTQIHVDNDTGLQIMNQTQLHVDNETRLRITNNTVIQDMIRDRQQLLLRQLNETPIQDRDIVRNQDRIILGSESVIFAQQMGGLGPGALELAQAINASVPTTVRDEEMIRARSSFVRFLIGGDAAAAQNLSQQVSDNQDRLRLLLQQADECNCDSQTQTLLRDQLRDIQVEQDRLRLLAQQELADKGIFGGLFR